MRSSRVLSVVLAVLLLALAAGCTTGDDTTEEPAPEPLVAPPVITEEGVLRVGIDADYPPFAGVDNDRTVGFDIDVAAAVGDRLGLMLEIVDVGPDGYPTALAEGDIDVALAAISITEAVLADVSFAGAYAMDSPAYFSATETSETVQSLAGKVVGAQKASPIYWELQARYGEDFPVSYSTLREAFQAAADGGVDLVACDAMVGAYIGRDFPSVRFVATADDVVPLGIVVAKEDTELEATVRDVLDTLAADGVLAIIHAKWFGNLPILETVSDAPE